MNQTRPPAQNAALGRALRLVYFARSPGHRQPRWAAIVAATALSIAGSLLADWLLAKLGVAVFASTRGYPHFRFSDYSRLTILGVLAACIGWPIVTRFCLRPRWLFVRLAVLVSIVLLLPDLYIWLQGQPTKAVIFLVFMHIAIAVITYNALVYIAPTGNTSGGAAGGRKRGSSAAG